MKAILMCLLLAVACPAAFGAQCDINTVRAFLEKAIVLPALTGICDKQPGTKEQHYDIARQALFALMNDREFLGSVSVPDPLVQLRAGRLFDAVAVCIKRETNMGNMCDRNNQELAIACGRQHAMIAMPLLRWVGPNCDAIIERFYNGFDQNVIPKASELAKLVE